MTGNSVKVPIALWLKPPTQERANISFKPTSFLRNIILVFHITRQCSHSTHRPCRTDIVSLLKYSTGQPRGKNYKARRKAINSLILAYKRTLGWQEALSVCQMRLCTWHYTDKGKIIKAALESEIRILHMAWSTSLKLPSSGFEYIPTLYYLENLTVVHSGKGLLDNTDRKTKNKSILDRTAFGERNKKLVDWE